MAEIIITTPEQLKTVILETVQNEMQRHFKALSPAEPATVPQNDLLTRKEAAKLLGVSFPTLNEWSKTGVITGYRIATRVRYKHSELVESLLQMQTKKTRRAA
jgi:excisionase family DNA binding protein